MKEEEIKKGCRTGCAWVFIFFLAFYLWATYDNAHQKYREWASAYDRYHWYLETDYYADALNGYYDWDACIDDMGLFWLLT